MQVGEFLGKSIAEVLELAEEEIHLWLAYMSERAKPR